MVKWIQKQQVLYRLCSGWSGPSTERENWKQKLCYTCWIYSRKMLMLLSKSRWEDSSLVIIYPDRIRMVWVNKARDTCEFQKLPSICGKYSSSYALPKPIEISIAYAQGVGKAGAPWKCLTDCGPNGLVSCSLLPVWPILGDCTRQRGADARELCGNVGCLLLKGSP
jgi:hypothetical protein